MKRFFAFFAVLAFPYLVLAQSPFYILFNKSCMDVLEYKFTYYNTVQQVYAVRAGGNEQYFLKSANEGINSPTLPPGTVQCNDLRLPADFVDAVNNHTRNFYVIFQQQQGGYLLMPIIEATQVIRNGAYYMVRGTKYAFALDTTRLVNETNLATGNSQSLVYFTGMKFRNCRMEYSFHREPLKTNQERADFEFISGLGITGERSGINAAEAESNHVRLVKVNGLSLDDFIDQQCGGKNTGGKTISTWTPPAGYGSGQGNSNAGNYQEPDKENASISQKPGDYAYNQQGLVNCPVMPGEGYHVVQPGDNLRAIARTYDVTLARLVDWNKLKNPNKIEVCQVIWLKKPPANAKNLVAKGEQTNTAPANTEKGRQVINQSAYWNGGGGQAPQSPVQHSTNTNVKPENYGPSNNTVTTISQARQPQIHRVKSGDYLYKLAKDYGCPEECIRRANNMPLEGDVTLWPGQELIIPECTCRMPQQNNPQGVAPNQYNTPNTNPKPQPGSFLEQPAGTDPYQRENTGYGNQPKPESTTDENKQDQTYFTEHIVVQGETLNSISYKYRINAAELSQVNGLNPNDPLQPGKRLLIPHK